MRVIDRVEILRLGGGQVEEVLGVECSEYSENTEYSDFLKS